MPPQVEASTPAPQTFTVVQGTVGAAVDLTATVTWPGRPIATGAAAGTVTTVDVEAGSTVALGAVLYTVDLKPVVVAQGTVPSFRDVGAGATGADIEQIERFLVAQGA